jgi:hypothetical protein
LGVFFRTANKPLEVTACKSFFVTGLRVSI